jgi:hypothetical protein
MPISLKNATSTLPWARYSPQANVLTIAGEDGKPREISFVGRSFAVDVENGSMGWLLIAEGARDWVPYPINADPPPKPSPAYRKGFSVLFFAPKLLGSPEPHEMCASTNAHLSFCERLYNACEPHFNEGNVPIVKIVSAESIKAGKGKSRDIQFEIPKWIPRPTAIIEALTKLREAAETTTNKKSTGTNGATQTDTGGDVKPEAEPKKTTEKPKARAKKAQAEEPHSSDLLDDEIPFA